MAVNDELVLKLKADISDMKTQLNNVEKGLNKVEKKGQEATNNLVKQFRTAGNMIKGYLTGKIAAGLKNILDEQNKLIGQFRALQQMKGYDQIADQMERVNKVTGGMATKLEVVGSVNKALAFGIDLSNGRLEKLIKVSQKTAMIMGTDLRSAFDDLITGVARESKMILDNNGIQLDLNKTLTDYASRLGKATDELTKTERMTAIMNEALKQMDKNTKDIDVKKTLTPYQKVTKMLANDWKNIKESIADTVNTMLDPTWEKNIQRSKEELKIQEKMNELKWDFKAINHSDFTLRVLAIEKIQEEKEEQEELKRQAELTNQIYEEGIDFKSLSLTLTAKEIDLLRKKNLELAGGESISIRGEGIKIADPFEKQNKRLDESIKKIIAKIKKSRKKIKTAIKPKSRDDEMVFTTQDANKIERELAQEKVEIFKNMVTGINNEITKLGTQEGMLGGFTQFKDINEDSLKKIQDDWKDFESRVSGIGDTLGQGLTGTFNDVYAAMIEGSDIALDQLVRNFFIQSGAALVSDGTVNLWKGAAQTLLGNPVGPALAALGAGEIAAGFAMGFVGKQIPAPATSSTTGASEGMRGGDGQPIVVNIQTSAFGNDIAQATSELTPVFKKAKRTGII